MAAVKGALSLQGNQTSQSQRSVWRHLERFGMDREKMAAYREALAPDMDNMNTKGVTDLACRAMALGFADKWVK